MKRGLMVLLIGGAIAGAALWRKGANATRVNWAIKSLKFHNVNTGTLGLEIINPSGSNYRLKSVVGDLYSKDGKNRVAIVRMLGEKALTPRAVTQVDIPFKLDAIGAGTELILQLKYLFGGTKPAEVLKGQSFVFRGSMEVDGLVIPLESEVGI